MGLTLHRLRKMGRNIPSLLKGYNIYVDTDKLRLIDRVFQVAAPVHAFADLGGIWKVRGAYALYAMKKSSTARGLLVDTDLDPRIEERLARTPGLHIIKGDFTSPEVATSIGGVDVIFFFDVLLHQANPSWDATLTRYADITSCMAIYNQQFVLGRESVRLTSLPLEEYVALAPRGRREMYEYVYAHGDDIHPAYNKPWRDIHNIFQWGITDRDLRNTMQRLGFRDVYFANHGRFSDLPAFENHAFIFVREPTRGNNSARTSGGGHGT